MLEFLYKNRIEKLKEKGIDIDFDEVINYFDIKDLQEILVTTVEILI
jgi:hypothetical protein